MRFEQKVRQLGLKLLNLRLVDRRKTKYTLFLVDRGALELTNRPITIPRDEVNEYNLYTRVGMRVQPPSDASKIINPT